ncbi:hypothetical protein, partial [Kitasatospora nipponensis]|uniref:hypothetical protein n=1 Tax=Kitasatospora nipponensis TaxID=258049 RepID=UPI0031E496AF
MLPHTYTRPVEGTPLAQAADAAVDPTGDPDAPPAQSAGRAPARSTPRHWSLVALACAAVVAATLAAAPAVRTVAPRAPK